jgi:hypothetical protein
VVFFGSLMMGWVGLYLVGISLLAREGIAVVGVEANHQVAQVVLCFPFPFLCCFPLVFSSYLPLVFSSYFYFLLVIGIVHIDQLILNLRPFSTKSLPTVILLKTLLTIVLLEVTLDFLHVI